MSSAEADGWAWLLVLSFVFGCNVLRILLPSFSSFVSGARGSPTGRARAGFPPQKRLGWAVLGFKKEIPGHPRPRFHVAASLRLGVLSGPPPSALMSLISWSSRASSCPRLPRGQCPAQRGVQGPPEASAFLARRGGSAWSPRRISGLEPPIWRVGRGGMGWLTV